jgi:hypothetical protein
MTPTLLESWLRISRFLVQSRDTLDADGRYALSQLLAHIENPRMEEPANTDALERWAAGKKDMGAFRPSTVLWKDYLEWCRHMGEPPGTLPVFYARLKKKPWLRKGRTRVAGVSRNGWYGLKL